MSEDSQGRDRFPKPAKLAIALLENVTKPVVVEGFQRRLESHLHSGKRSTR